MMQELARHPPDCAASHFNYSNDNCYDKNRQRKNQLDFSLTYPPKTSIFINSGLFMVNCKNKSTFLGA